MTTEFNDIENIVQGPFQFNWPHVNEMVRNN